MVCPNGLPADLSGLSALQTLDLAFNNLNSTTDRLAQVRVFLHLDIQCSMRGLTVLWVWSVSTACLLTCLACQPSKTLDLTLDLTLNSLNSHCWQPTGWRR